MDPNAAMKQILEELASDKPDREQVAHLLVGLSEWIANGGFLPNVEKVYAAIGSTQPGYIVSTKEQVLPSENTAATTTALLSLIANVRRRWTRLKARDGYSASDAKVIAGLMADIANDAKLAMKTMRFAYDQELVKAACNGLRDDFTELRNHEAQRVQS